MIEKPEFQNFQVILRDSSITFDDKKKCETWTSCSIQNGYTNLFFFFFCFFFFFSLAFGYSGCSSVATSFVEKVNRSVDNGGSKGQLWMRLFTRVASNTHTHTHTHTHMHATKKTFHCVKKEKKYILTNNWRKEREILTDENLSIK